MLGEMLSNTIYVSKSLLHMLRMLFYYILSIIIWKVSPSVFCVHKLDFKMDDMSAPQKKYLSHDVFAWCCFVVQLKEDFYYM